MSLRRKLFIFVALPLLVAFLGFVVIALKNNRISLPTSGGRSSLVDQTPIKAGQQLSHNRCTGEGVTNQLSVSPMKTEDFTHIIPYGLMVGGHVTPIDHQYFSPQDYKSPVDAYEVRAMADSTIVEIQGRMNNNPNLKSMEYRFVFTVSCTFFYYYDLVTSLAPDIQAEYDKQQRNGFASLNIPVKAGQLVGRIGGRTLDFAVWDTTKPLKGFVVPEHYQSEAWKIYTADPLDYYTDQLKQLLLSKYVRTAEPISGKIDYDIDGKLVGNWFEVGSNGYEGTKANRDQGGYWKTHLSISPDHYDPTQYIVSIGYLWGTVKGDENMQFMIKPGAVDPAKVSVETGVTKYDLSTWRYYTTDGSVWQQFQFPASPVTAKADDWQKGCAVTELIEPRKLKFELFANQACQNIPAFTDSVKTYER